MSGNLSGMNNMEDLVEDLLKIYISSIDSNNAKIMQNVNEKYTIIDKSMISAYLYVKILKNLKIDDEISKEVLLSYLTKQNIYGETGNLALEISNEKRKNLYNEVLNHLVIEQFEYKNRILKKLKYNYKIIEKSQYSDLIEFCESIAEFYILDKLLKRGNWEVLSYINNLKNKFESYLNLNTKNSGELEKEKIKIYKLILDEDFEKTEYYNLIQIALKLKDVYRYSTLTTVVPEDVLFHQYSMTVANIVFADYMISKGEKIDKYKLVCKTLFHDFGEYKGNEIVSQIKLYNEETKAMFAEIEENDEKELEKLLGKDIYKIISEYKNGKEGYIADILDKILGIMKLWVEVGYMNNYTYIKSLCSVYQGRFSKFKNIDRIEELKDKDFLLEFLKNAYVYVKENLVNANPKILAIYFTEEEIKEFKEEISYLKKIRFLK